MAAKRPARRNSDSRCRARSDSPPAPGPRRGRSPARRGGTRRSGWDGRKGGRRVQLFCRLILVDVDAADVEDARPSIPRRRLAAEADAEHEVVRIVFADRGADDIEIFLEAGHDKLLRRDGRVALRETPSARTLSRYPVRPESGRRPRSRARSTAARCREIADHKGSSLCGAHCVFAAWSMSAANCGEYTSGTPRKVDARCGQRSMTVAGRPLPAGVHAPGIEAAIGAFGTGVVAPKPAPPPGAPLMPVDRNRWPSGSTNHQRAADLLDAEESRGAGMVFL